MKATYDAVVLGAGIVGAACARELAAAGMSVAIIERDSVAGAATGAAMGHIVAMDDSEAQFALTRYSQSLWDALAPELPPSVEYNRCGTIWVAADEEELAEARRKVEFYSSRGVPAELLSPSKLADAEPNLSRRVAGGMLVASDAVLSPAGATEYLVGEARRHKAELIVGRFAAKAGDGRVVIDNGTELAARFIVNATGVFAAELTPGIAIRKRKGHLVLTERSPGFLHHQLVELGYLKSAHSSTADSVAFNVQPHRNGQVLVGSSRQYGAKDTGVDHQIVAAMMERACLFMPGLASLSIVREWSGLRAATADKLPLIGPTEDPSVFLATGHEGLGITTSLASGRLLADHMLDRAPAIPIEPYLPSRTTSERGQIPPPSRAGPLPQRQTNPEGEME